MVQAPPKRKKSFPVRFSSTEEQARTFSASGMGSAYAGTHLIIDLVRAERLDDLEHIEQTLRRCVEVAGATLLHIHLHHFTPNGGVSGVAVLAELHISIHSWPEYGYAALDVFMCGANQSASGHRRPEGGLLASQGGGQGAYARQGNESMERWVEETLHRGFRVRLKADARPLRQRDRAPATDHLRERRLWPGDDARQHRPAHHQGRVRLSRDDERTCRCSLTARRSKALIVGGGDGGVLREVLKHPELEAGHAVRDRPRRDRSLPPAFPGDFGRRL